MAPVYLGIDVGFSKDVASTGVCIISPAGAKTVRATHVRTEGTLEAVRRLLGDETPTAISINGPLVPHAAKGIFKIINRYRICERNLSGGVFQKRCKPGPTNSPRGQSLHRQATFVANSLLLDHPKARVVEAFPNAFLGVMMPPSIFKRPIRRGIKSDVFWRFGVRRRIIDRLVEHLFNDKLLPPWRRLENHDERAAFVCALTARASEAGSAVAIPGDGEILLPPRKFIQPWALDELCRRIPTLNSVALS